MVLLPVWMTFPLQRTERIGGGDPCACARVSRAFSGEECLQFLVFMDQTLKSIWGEEIFLEAKWAYLGERGRLTASNAWKRLDFRAIKKKRWSCNT